MTTTQPRQTAPRRPVSLGQSRARRDQLLCLTLIIFFLACIFALQPLLTRLRVGQLDEHGRAVRNAAGHVVTPGIVPPPPEAVKQLAAEFPRLTLGGFRGLLVPLLWQQSEDDKNERRWQDLDTTYNIIGKLEPYFEPVYAFNAWNQAYNLSAQWHGIDEKFQWVLEGLNHLYEGEEFIPNNPDLVYEIAQMYFMKIAGSFERITFRQMWRESIAHQYELEEAANHDQKTVEKHRRVRDFILKPQFHITLLENPRDPAKVGYGVRVSGLRKNADGVDQPVDFPYGLSPYYFAYIEYQRAIKTGWPSTTGETIVAGLPAMSLRLWCRDDTYYSQIKLREMFYKTAEGEPAPPVIPDFDAQVLDIRDCYRNVTFVAPMCIDLFAQYMKDYAAERVDLVHTKHVMEVIFTRKIAAAESDMFEGLVAWYVGENNQGRKMTDAARAHFTACLPEYLAAIDSLEKYVDYVYPATNPSAKGDRADYFKYADAMRLRMDGIQKMLAAAPNDPIDFSFLQSDTVER